MLSMLISIESILYILFLEKYFFLKFINTAPTRGSMTLVVIYKGGTCTKALIMDITTYLVKLYQSKGYNNYLKVCQPCAAFNPFSEQLGDNKGHGSR